MDRDIRFCFRLFVLKAAAVRHTVIAGNAVRHKPRADVSHYEPWLVSGHICVANSWQRQDIQYIVHTYNISYIQMDLLETVVC